MASRDTKTSDCRYGRYPQKIAGHVTDNYQLFSWSLMARVNNCLVDLYSEVRGISTEMVLGSFSDGVNHS